MVLLLRTTYGKVGRWVGKCIDDFFGECRVLGVDDGTRTLFVRTGMGGGEGRGSI